MLNQVVLVGKIFKIKNIKDGALLTVKIPGYENNEHDYIKTMLRGKIAENTLNYCKEEDVIGIKGRLICNDETENKIEIEVDKLTFLSTYKKD